MDWQLRTRVRAHYNYNNSKKLTQNTKLQVHNRNVKGKREGVDLNVAIGKRERERSNRSHLSSKL